MKSRHWRSLSTCMLCFTLSYCNDAWKKQTTCNTHSVHPTHSSCTSSIFVFPFKFQTNKNRRTWLIRLINSNHYYWSWTIRCSFQFYLFLIVDCNQSHMLNRLRVPLKKASAQFLQVNAMSVRSICLMGLTIVFCEVSARPHTDSKGELMFAHVVRKSIYASYRITLITIFFSKIVISPWWSHPNQNISNWFI